MLILTRKLQEAVVLETRDGPIRVVVVGSGKNVRLGIEAPRSVSIVREEIQLPCVAEAACG